MPAGQPIISPLCDFINQILGEVVAQSSRFLLVLIIPVLLTSQVHACDKAAAQKALSTMRPYIVVNAVEEDGWIVVTLGPDYFSWSDRQTEGVVTTYANADACITGQARKLEFRSPSGKLVARADKYRGIQMK